jgi:hypothetical protein
MPLPREGWKKESADSQALFSAQQKEWEKERGITF